MPKIYTHATVSSSDQTPATLTARAVLRSYYCLCGDFVLVVQGKLDRLARRRSDGASILRTRGSSSAPVRKFKLVAGTGERVVLERAAAPAAPAAGRRYEVRQMFVCNRCKTPAGGGGSRLWPALTQVAYQTSPPPAGRDTFLYILRGAVTDTQGRVPPDAFEGEGEDAAVAA